MCGIAALLSPKESLNPEIIRRALPALEHRGPDERQSWTADHGHVSLGHTRLSIIGLHNGQQPLSNEDGSIHAVVNGEFYGFETIRDELKASGHAFKTESDSEIAVHLYEKMGMECLRRLRGEFAFIIWDENKQTLFVARDRFGIKPVYYAKVDGRLYVASEIKALLAMGVPARWDRETVRNLSSGFVLRSGRTLFDGIFAVPPGHYLTVTKNDFKISRYWDFDYPRAGSLKDVPDFEQATEMVRAKINEAVRLRLRSDVPVGVYLSGGIDSCAVLGLASKITQRRLRAFTLTFNTEAYDESAVAKEMAAHCGAEYCPIEIKPQDLADDLAATVIQGETLITNTHAVAKHLLSRAVRRAGFKVVLTGEGSDEVFAGYAPFKKDMILHNSKDQDPNVVRDLLDELQRTNTVSTGLLLADGHVQVNKTLENALGFVPSFLEAFSSMGSKMSEFMNPDYFQTLEGRDNVRDMLNELDVDGQILGREPVHQAMYLWSKSMLPNYILTVLGDRMEMGHSIEGRVPFLDHELVELVTQLPVSYKIRGLTEKHVLREATKDVLTETVYKRQKHPFLAPPSTLNETDPLYGFVQDTLRGPNGLDRLPFYDRQRVLDLMDKIPDLNPMQRAATDPLLMQMVSGVLLSRHYGL